MNKWTPWSRGRRSFKCRLVVEGGSDLTSGGDTQRRGNRIFKSSSTKLVLLTSNAKEPFLLCIKRNVQNFSHYCFACNVCSNFFFSLNTFTSTTNSYTTCLKVKIFQTVRTPFEVCVDFLGSCMGGSSRKFTNSEHIAFEKQRNELFTQSAVFICRPLIRTFLSILLYSCSVLRDEPKTGWYQGRFPSQNPRMINFVELVTIDPKLTQ